MRFISRLLSFLLVSAAALTAQQRINPATQINWPSCTGGAVFYDIVHNTCVAGSATGVTSIDGQTGAFTFSGAVSHIGNAYTFTGGSGGGGLPTTTAFLATTTSGLYDDNDSNSRSLGVPTSVNCVHTTTSTCTLVFGSPHAVPVRGAVDMTSLASWPVGISGANQQAAQYGSFMVTTVPNSTTLTFTTPTVLTYTCGPCTGNVYDASFWAIWRFANKPSVYGHGTVFGVETTTQSAVANLATWVAALPGGSTPLILVNDSGQNDLAAGRTVSQVETDTESLLAAAHSLGMITIQVTLTPAQYGVTGVGFKAAQINQWIWDNHVLGVTAAQKTSGKYVDWYADVATSLASFDNTASMPDPLVNDAFGTVLNQVIATQGGVLYSKPIGTFSGSGLGPNVPTFPLNKPQYDVDENFNVWRLRQYAGGWQGDTYYANGLNPIMSFLNGGLSSGNWCSDAIGYDGSSNNIIWRALHMVSPGSSSNYVYYRNGCAGTSSSDIMRVYANGNVSFPSSLGATANPAPTCPNGPNGELTTTGCTGSGGTGGGTVTYTTNTTASSGDSGKLVIMNCSGACAYTLPNPQPSTTWYANVVTVGSTNATIALGSSITYNLAASVPVLNKFRMMKVYANTTTATDYEGEAPLVAGANITNTPSSNGFSQAAAGGGGGSGGLSTTITTNTTAIPANSCNPSGTMTATALAAVTTASTIDFTPTVDTRAITGWGANGGLVFAYTPTAGTVNWAVCNQTSSSITPGSSITWNVSTNGSASAWQVSLTFVGAPAANQVLLLVPSTIPVVIPASCAGSYMGALTAATAAYDVTIAKLSGGVTGGSTTLCTAHFAIAGQTASFSGAGGSLSAGDYLEITGQATPDATLAGIGGGIYGTH